MSDERKGRLFVALAALAWSTAGVLQRELSVSTATQVGGRALFAALGLLAYTALTERSRWWRSMRAIGLGGVLRRAEPRVRRERALLAGPRADLRGGARHAARRPGRAPNLGRDGRGGRRGRGDGRRAGPRERARPVAFVLRLGVVRRHDRDRPAPARCLDGARDVPLAGDRARRRGAVRVGARGRRRRAVARDARPDADRPRLRLLDDRQPLDPGG